MYGLVLVRSCKGMFQMFLEDGVDRLLLCLSLNVSPRPLFWLQLLSKSIRRLNMRSRKPCGCCSWIKKVGGSWASFEKWSMNQRWIWKLMFPFIVSQWWTFNGVVRLCGISITSKNAFRTLTLGLSWRIFAWYLWVYAKVIRRVGKVVSSGRRSESKNFFYPYVEFS